LQRETLLESVYCPGGFVENKVSKEQESIRIVIADDSPAIREMLHLTLSSVEGIVVAGIASDGSGAVQLARKLRPQIVVLDVSMPCMDGIEALKQIRADDYDAWIVMFTAAPSELLREACLQAGADYFFGKTEIENLIELCRRRLLEN
jgi:CheY-like chemotaxis protein